MLKRLWKKKTGKKITGKKITGEKIKEGKLKDDASDISTERSQDTGSNQSQTKHKVKKDRSFKSVFDYRSVPGLIGLLFIHSVGILAVIVLLIILLFAFSTKELFVNVDADTSNLNIIDNSEVSDMQIENLAVDAHEIEGFSLADEHAYITLSGTFTVETGTWVTDGPEASYEWGKKGDVYDHAFLRLDAIPLKESHTDSSISITGKNDSLISCQMDNVNCDSAEFQDNSIIVKNSTSMFFHISGDSTMYIEPFVGLATVVNPNGEDKEYSDEHFRIVVPKGETVYAWFPNCAMGDVRSISSKINNITDLTLFGNGEVSVTYTADSKEYKVNKKPVSLFSRNNGFSIVVSQNNDKHQPVFSVSGYGFVNKVELANVSIEPSPSGWFRENIYLLPTSVVTIVLGSVKLIELTKKKETEKNEKEKEKEIKAGSQEQDGMQK